MKKIFVLILTSLIGFSALFAGGRKDVDSSYINLLPSYTSMAMDMVSCGNTVYEALLAMDHTDLSEGTPIFLNKYVDNVYDSTLRLDVEGFTNYEFMENYSHYDFLKLYALSPDEIILTVYASFSDNRFAFFRIKDGKVIAYKSYSLKNQSASESQLYAFNGKDTIYVAFNGMTDFQKRGWDLYLMSFDLDGNLKKSVTIGTKKNDELIALAAFDDGVYFGIRETFEKQAVLRLSKDLEFEKCWACKSPGSGIRLFDCESDAESANLLVTFYMENQSADFVARYSSAGDFISAYKIDESASDSEFNFCKKKISDAGVLYFGQRVRYDDGFGERLGADFITYFVDWDGNKTYEKIFKDKNNLNFKRFASVDGKYFCTGEKIHTGDGIGHIAYTYLVGGKSEDTSFVSIEKTDLNPFALPENPDAREKRVKEMEKWEKRVSVEDIEIPVWDFGYDIQKIRLPYKHALPDSKDVTDTIPLFPFSER